MLVPIPISIPIVIYPFPKQPVSLLKLTLFLQRLEELGGSHVLCGLARLIMCLAEVPFFYLSGPLISLVGVRGVIGLTQLAYLTRFIYYSVRVDGWYFK